MNKQYDKNLVNLWDEQELELTYPTEGITTEDRIAGAIMGALIGDALAHGYLWNYDYKVLWERNGTWVTDYSDPFTIEGGQGMDEISNYRHKVGIRAGMSSQTGQLIQVLLETLATNARKNGTGEFVNEEYIANINHFFEHDLLPKAQFAPEQDIYDTRPGTVGTYLGEPGGIMCWSGRYTDRVVREIFDFWYNKGEKNGEWWSDTHNVSNTSTSDAAQFGVILAGLYEDPKQLFYKAYDLARMWFSDPAFVTQSVVYMLAVNAVINGVPLESFRSYFPDLGIELREIRNKICSYDDLSVPGRILPLAKRPQVFSLPDDRFMAGVFGTNCHIYHLLPCAYYYAYKYAHDFEKGLLVAVNSSGNNMARATLTGGLLGAMNGIQAIPQRLIDGLIDEPGANLNGQPSQGTYLLDLAKTVATGRQKKR
jgi:ADP-ribosyl-[dinitrogen reductase] hydrolase